ncbi:MepB family protein [Lactococcus piscium]|uniref:MepB protein n=1 Tax=Pseudolactococcus paracarnosus TaxID=2749962 RepID=A0A7L4WFY0_9LACT|nr:MepB family protein [Lactococcus paracarnosus]MCJ1994305.1 MepB family protein [Lactococcus paracarnosus]QDJ28383.1 MepB protein [Lactococcus paracarnosus]SPC35205.1 conserved hypothetical protein [Lactococcus piscium]
MKTLTLIAGTLSAFDKVSIKKVHEETQNSEYEGLIVTINGQSYRSRLAKLTPKKMGYFVAFWEKDASDQNQAFDMASTPDKLIISIIDGDLKGQFVFPKSILINQGVLRREHVKGKMAMRVYPTWLDHLNPTASKTQKWQGAYFVDLSSEVDHNRVAQLYFT